MADLCLMRSAQFDPIRPLAPTLGQWQLQGTTVIRVVVSLGESSAEAVICRCATIDKIDGSLRDYSISRKWRRFITVDVNTRFTRMPRSG